MSKQTSSPRLAVLLCTIAFLGAYGVVVRGQVGTQEQSCVGKPYGTAGCPLKEVSDSCGDNRVGPGEECDNGSGRNGTGNCSKECLFLSCGDGIVSADLGEECEPQREEVYAIDPATGELTTELHFMAASCGTVCSVPTCTESGICSGGCTKTFQPACTGSSAATTQSVIAHSDLHPAASESGSVSASIAAPASAPYVARCGNAIRDPYEECDDGNLFDTDGCTISCKFPRCGDGVVQAGEQCDDGNTLNTDSCTKTCRLPVCGDGSLQQGEQCDNGTANSDVSPNACRRDCRSSSCGDHVIDNGEECDGGDLCTVDCRSVKSIPALLVDTPGAGKVAIFLSAIGGVLVMAFIFRTLLRRFVRHVAGEKAAQTLDDIPLDEIEMPWMKW